MHRLLLIIIVLIVGFNISAKKKTPFIPNCTEIHDHVYMSHTEVTNIMYHEYLSYMKSELNESDYKLLLPDTLVWRTKNTYGEPYVEYYFRHPAYRQYPVVGLSKVQAEKFWK